MKRITKWHKDWNTVSWPITFAWNLRVKGRNQPSDFERELYDLGQDHAGTPRAADLLKYILEHL